MFNFLLIIPEIVDVCFELVPPKDRLPGIALHLRSLLLEAK